MAENGYRLHFVEFDDQGWLYPGAIDKVDGAVGNPGQQIDCAIGDLKRTLESNDRQGRVILLVYVHGWHHTAKSSDDDLRDFKAVLAERARLFKPLGRQVIGIYVGWKGETVDVPGLSMLTFWSRKNAAHHVAGGRVRELFSRVRGLRAYWNGRRIGTERAAVDCDVQPGDFDRCQLRTVLIGHSFGGLIVFESAAPYLLETLTSDRDIAIEGPRRPAARARGIADLVVLLNPAFEASKYEPIHQASLNYRPAPDEQPLLVSLTSSADWATGKAFPAIRYLNTALQYPATSPRQSQAMRRTPGHVDAYLTHLLCAEDNALCRAEESQAREAVHVAVAAQTRGATEPAPAALPYALCGMSLRWLRPSQDVLRPPIVWNVRTDKTIIGGHNDIDGGYVLAFVEQLYGRITGTPTRCTNPLQ